VIDVAIGVLLIARMVPGYTPPAPTQIRLCIQNETEGYAKAWIWRTIGDRGIPWDTLLTRPNSAECTTLVGVRDAFSITVGAGSQSGNVGPFPGRYATPPDKRANCVAKSKQGDLIFLIKRVGHQFECEEVGGGHVHT
jgi:hypothetical protein